MYKNNFTSSSLSQINKMIGVGAYDTITLKNVIFGILRKNVF